MMNDMTMIHNNTIFTTGDKITCKYNGNFISDARIHICTQEEMKQIIGASSAWSNIILIFNNEFDHHYAGKTSERLGYKYIRACGTYKGSNTFTDGITDLKLKEKDELKNLIDIIILNDKLSIQKKY
jgi:hypothetical protein